MIKKDRLQVVMNYYLENGIEATCKNFKLSSETIYRYKREARARDVVPGEKRALEAPNVLVFDIETSLMSFFGWSTGKQYVGPDQIITDWYAHSWAAKWLFEPDVYSDVQTPEEAREDNDERIIRSIWEFMDKADILIGHNIRRFDVRNAIQNS